MPKRVLIIINTIDAGGAETFVMKVFRCILPHGYIFDFLINKRDSNFYLGEITKLGGKVFYGYSKSNNPAKSFNFIKKTVKENQYKCVFCVAVHPIGFLDIFAAKLGGATTILTRSTNSNSGGKASALLAKISRPFMRRMSTWMLAPSKEAGEWLFGEKAVDNGNVKIIANGIDTNLYIYNEELRWQIRKEIGISDDTLVVGHVGRFNRQKNHRKLIQIFAEIKKREQNSCLILVGDGELLENVKSQVKELQIEDSVIFAGIRNDVPSLLMAFDVFCFPSLYEGMPNAVIEAQATGLPCFVTDTISRDVKITSYVKFLSLDDEADIWADSVIHYKNSDREKSISAVKNAGYSIENTANRLMEMMGV